jgi:tetratricopeptide (TPR) repeat protein
VPNRAIIAKTRGIFMRDGDQFDELLKKYIDRYRYSYNQLAYLSNVPKRTIANWVEGIVKKPRRWQDLFNVASALHLNDAEVSELLIAAGYPPIHELRELIGSQNEEDQAIFSKWAESTIRQYLHQLKPPPADFVGRRDEISLVKKAIDTRKTGIIGIFGFGGVGKTSLALQIANIFTPIFTDAQIQLDLKGTFQEPLSQTEVMDYVIRSFHRDFKQPESEPALKAIYRSKLQGLKTILFLDNVHDGKEISGLIPPKGSLLIITSRQYFELPGMLEIHLSNLSPADAQQLLLTISPRIGNYADEIASLCGYLPLALRLAGSALAGWNNLDPGEYVKWLSETKNRLNIIDSSLHLTHESHGIEASLSLSYDLLDRKTQELWSQLALFPQSFDVEATANLWSVSSLTALKVLSDLIVKCLVEYNPTTQRYSLHDLARLFADTQLSETERELGNKNMAQYFLQVFRKIEAQFKKGDENFNICLTLFDLEWPNIKTALEWTELHQEEEDALKIGNEYLKTETRLLHVRIPPKERIHWLEFGLECARKLNSVADEALHLKNLGAAWLDLGEIQRSIEVANSALDICRKISDRKNEGYALGNLGLAYNAKGEANRALEYFQQHLKIARRIGDRFGEGNALGNIGMITKNLGNPQAAIPYHEESLALSREIGDRAGEGATLNDLGTTYLDLEEFDKAISLYKQALEIFREVGDRKNEGNSLGNLGLVYSEMGDQNQAINFYQKALKIDREIGNRLGEEITLCNLGDLYLRLGNPDRTIKYCKSALKIAQEIGDRYGEAEAQSHWSTALEMLGESEQAKTYAENALGILEELEIEDSLTNKLRERLTNLGEKT